MAFCRLYLADKFTETAAEIGDGALLGATHPVLDLGEGLLDGIEVGRIRGQIPEPRAHGFDHAAQLGGFVAAEIVQDDDVAGFENWHELLRDVGAEALTVDWPVEDARGGELITAQCAEEGQCAPVTVRCEGPQALALWSPPAQRRHIGLDPGLVDKDQPARIEAGLP